MQDHSHTDQASIGLVRLGLRRIALAVTGAVAAIALMASLAVAPQPQDTTVADTADTTELIAGPSWGFTAPEGDIKPIPPGHGRGTWGPSWG